MRAESPWEVSTKNKSYRDWRCEVNERLQNVYRISIEDAGFDGEYLVRHWQSNEMAHEFVEWFGNKYELEPIRSLVLSHNGVR
jgi:hypothetical protein